MNFTPKNAILHKIQKKILYFIEDDGTSAFLFAHNKYLDDDLCIYSATNIGKWFSFEGWESHDNLCALKKYIK